MSSLTIEVIGYRSTLALESNLLSQNPRIFLSFTCFSPTIQSMPSQLRSQFSTSLAHTDFYTSTLLSFCLSYSTTLKMSFLISRSQMQLQQFCRGKYLYSTILTFSSSLSGYCSQLKLVNLLSLNTGSPLIYLIQLEMQGSILLLLLNSVSMWFLRSCRSAFLLVRLMMISWEGSLRSSFLRRLQYPTAWMVLSLGKIVVLMCWYSSDRFIVELPYNLRKYASSIINNINTGS